MAHDVEVLDLDPSPRRRLWLPAVLALVLVVVGVLAYADQRARAHEAHAVSECEVRLRTASALSERRLGLLTNYVQPATARGAGARGLHLADLMASRARWVLPRVQRADRVCRAVSVRPWHFGLVSRRDVARAYSAAVVTLLQTVAAQGRAHFGDYAVLARLRAAAGAD